MPNSVVFNDPTLYVSGLSFNWSSSKTIIIRKGACRDSSNINDIIIDIPKIIRGTANGANGLDIGVLANTTKYNVFVIGSSTNKAPDAGIISADEIPYMPFNYDMYRLIGTVYTDGSAIFRDFQQTGEGRNRFMFYNDPFSVLAAGNSETWANVVLGETVPNQATSVFILGAITPSAAGRKVYLKSGLSVSTDGNARISGDVTSVESWGDVTLPCGEGSPPAIQYKVDNASDAVDLYVKGYLHAL